MGGRAHGRARLREITDTCCLKRSKTPSVCPRGHSTAFLGARGSRRGWCGRRPWRRLLFPSPLASASLNAPPTSMTTSTPASRAPRTSGSTLGICRRARRGRYPKPGCVYTGTRVRSRARRRQLVSLISRPCTTTCTISSRFRSAGRTPALRWAHWSWPESSPTILNPLVHSPARKAGSG